MTARSPGSPTRQRVERGKPPLHPWVRAADSAADRCAGAGVVGVVVVAAAVPLHHVEGAVEVDLDGAAVGLGDGDFVAVLGEVAGDGAGRAAAGGLDRRGLRPGGVVTGDGRLGALV